MNRLYKDFDLPTQHLTGGRYYVPPKARSSSEIDRRHEIPRGTILTEQQQRGIQVANFVLQNIDDPQDLFFAANLLAPAVYNSSWHTIAEKSPNMRLRLKLPRLDMPTDTLIAQVRATFTQMEVHAKSHVAAQTEQAPYLPEARERLGRGLGEAALLLGCLPLQDDIADVSAVTAQAMARDAGLQTVYVARLAGETGTPRTLAQLCDRDSDLAVGINREAPNRIYETFNDALATFAMPR